MTDIYETVIYTIGHGSRTIDDFVTLLIDNEILTLVDIRSRPESKKNPQFCEQSLRDALSLKNIVYHWAGRQLGGKRKLQNNNLHSALEDNEARAFAGHMESEYFKSGAAQVLSLARSDTIALMCSEYHPAKCHRSLIADFLLLEGASVIHIIDTDILQEHQLNSHARRETRSLVYDRKVKQ